MILKISGSFIATQRLSNTRLNHASSPVKRRPSAVLRRVQPSLPCPARPHFSGHPGRELSLLPEISRGNELFSRRITGQPHDHRVGGKPFEGRNHILEVPLR